MKFSALFFTGLILVLFFTLPKQQDAHLPDLAAVMHSHDNIQFQQTLHQLLTSLRQRGHVMDYVLLGDFLLRYGYCEEANAIYQGAIQRDPQQYNALIGFAVTLDELGYLNEAIEAYQAAALHADEDYEKVESLQRQGELYLRMEQTDQAKAIFIDMNYAPALVKLCRIYVHDQNFELAQAVFNKLHSSDQKNESLEVYQLNALALRHFGKVFAAIDNNRQRRLVYSDHMPLEMRKTLAEQTFRLDDMDLFGKEISRLPVINPDSQQYSDQHIISASYDPQQRERGELIYRTKNCIICHGADARGTTGPNLLDDFWITESISPSQMYLSIYHGRNNNTMPAYKHLLSPEDIRDVCGWLIHMYRTGTRDQAGNTTSGKEAQGQHQLLLD